MPTVVKTETSAARKSTASIRRSDATRLRLRLKASLRA